MPLTEDDIADHIGRCIALIDQDAERPGVSSLDHANIQQGIIQQTAADIAAGRPVVWSGLTGPDAGRG